MTEQSIQPEAKLVWSVARQIWACFFWGWGFLGLLYLFLEIAALPYQVGVGSSAYVSLKVLFWIGGLLLSGIGALLGDVAH